MKIISSFFGLIRTILLIIALLMGGVAFFRTGGFSDIKWDLQDIKESINEDILSKISKKMEKQAKVGKDFSSVQTYILKAKLAIVEKKDFNSATKYLGTAREMLDHIKKDVAYEYRESIDKITKKIDELGKEFKSGIYIDSNKFEEILLNLEILDKANK